MTRDMEKANGTTNLFSYSNPEVDKVLTKALSTINDEERKKLVQQASKIVMQDDHGVLALLGLKFVYAARKGLVFHPEENSYLTAMQVQPGD
jgi:peptide/nickel transport system substrate-binding protein